MPGQELTQEHLEATMNDAHARLREGTPESIDQARDLLEEIVEACDGAQAAPMMRLQCAAKYELAGILHDDGHDVEARALYLEAIDGFSTQKNCHAEALNAKMAYGLILSEADDMEAAIPLLEEAYSAHSVDRSTCCRRSSTPRRTQAVASARASSRFRRDEMQKNLLV